jgi:hypothetical protein
MEAFPNNHNWFIDNQNTNKWTKNDWINSHMHCLQVGENKLSKNEEPTQTGPQMFQ